MYIIPGEGLLVADSDDDLPWSGPPGGSVRFIIKREGSLVAYSDDVLPLSGPPGGSVRYIFQEKDHSWPIVSDDDLPLSGTNSGSVRYIFPGEGLLMADSDNDLCISEWAAWWLCQVYHSWRGIACEG